jgi:hypothetical protein
MQSNQNRRSFLGAAAGAAAFTIVPRHVLGGAGYVAPSDKITLGYIGTGTQGLREMMFMIPAPEIQIVAVCDPNKHAGTYRDFNRDGLLKLIRQTVGKPDWTAGGDAIPGGRDAAKSAVETYYAGQRDRGDFKGCSTYADFRELLDKEKDLNAVKIMTPDHLHGIIAIAAMKKGKHVITHKPIANRLKEAKLVIDTARETGVATHFMPWDYNGPMDRVMFWIKAGAIGTLREVHNWTNRPLWPQYPVIPSDTPAVPEGFDWDLWLGPAAERPYHPNYTNMVFRGWYDFGGGSMADMGHYSLWSVLKALELSGPTSIEPQLSHNCGITDSVARPIKNDYSFPVASVVRFRYPARGERAPVDVIWYDGGMRPPTPPELDEEKKELAQEGMMFVGDKGKILAGFNTQNPKLIPEKRMQSFPAPPAQHEEGLSKAGTITPGMHQWMAACHGGEASLGSMLNAFPITEAVNLYAVALRTGRRLLYDAGAMKITNAAEANRYLSREYRKGWEPAGV